MPTNVRLLKAFRLTHLYLGVFFTPALVFFAFTGAVQTFSLHETTKGSDYKPPQILVSLAQIHKKQTSVLPARKPGPDVPAKPEKHGPDASAPTAPTPAPAAPTPAPRKTRSPLPLKIFFLLVSISLFISTLTGIYMAYKYARKPLIITILLILGIIVPLLLVPA